MTLSLSRYRGLRVRRRLEPFFRRKNISGGVGGEKKKRITRNIEKSHVLPSTCRYLYIPPPQRPPRTGSHDNVLEYYTVVLRLGHQHPSDLYASIVSPRELAKSAQVFRHRVWLWRSPLRFCTVCRAKSENRKKPPRTGVSIRSVSPLIQPVPNE